MFNGLKLRWVRLIARRLSVFLALLLFSAPAFSLQSMWVRFGPNGRLVYAQSPSGDRIPDFSSAGYRGGGVALPVAAARVKISPTGSADDTPAIQAALNAVARLEPGSDGIRGAVELAPGTFHLAGTLEIKVSGVVLRGSGNSGKGATVLKLIGAPHLAIEVKGEFHQQALGPATMLIDAYVPAGATIVHVANASGIHPGDTLLIVKPVTPEWVHFMGMDHLSRDGKPEVWVKNDIAVRRRVASVDGNAVTLAVPLTDSFDSKFYPGFLPPVTPEKVTGQIAEVGVESLRISAPERRIDYQQDPEFDGIQMDNVADSWLRSLAFENTTNSVRIDRGAERLTITGVDVEQRAAVTSHAKPFDFSISGSQILLDRCSGRGDKVFYVATQSGSEGPFVVLHCRFRGDGAIEPHQRWSTGLLVDNCEVDGGSIDLMNRGEMGSGHGWTIGWSVLWNNQASGILVQNPPGAANWSIGDRGAQKSAPMPVFGENESGPLEGGIVESEGKHVEPASLYLEQLRERLGSAAVAAIGYQ
jgi:hypothetical protein